ncbi:MAG: helix-turn-helix domain-containing protein [Clostridiales Family XIII bacterium]|jgi:AraC-like DNA-binding protein|nr:helix-turn-helix domain-containing protein [Clostridiales Family XIII bacterium]
MDEKTKAILYENNTLEAMQLARHDFVPDLPQASYETHENRMELQRDYFLRMSDVYMSKHNRYAIYPEHTHDFIELNYMLSGSSKQLINGHEETLNQGEILLLDKGSKHTIETLEKDDILINIIFTNNNLDLKWLTSLGSKNSMLFDFLAKGLAKNSRKRYLIFRSGSNQHIQDILDRMIRMYFSNQAFDRDMVFLYIPILFTELVANVNYDQHQETSAETSNQVVIDMLKLIEANHTDLTLTSAAEQLGYNKNYLSNIIKKKTGHTFTQLLAKQRMIHAKYLLETTNLSINRIIEVVGLQNKSHFYKQFREEHGVAPMDLRKHTGYTPNQYAKQKESENV